MTLELKATLRETKIDPKKIRCQGFVPAIVYGHNIKNLPIKVLLKDFQKVFKQAGESTLIMLKIDNEAPRRVLIHDVQTHPLKGTIEHVDFYQVKADEKITVEIELRFVGTPTAVREKTGILVTPLNKLKVECLPGDLIHEIEVDLSHLKDVHEMIRVKDLKIPPKIKVLNNADEIVALIEAARVEEEVKKVEEVPVTTPAEASASEKVSEQKEQKPASETKSEK
jgi:large subunit ribosomal protein L25